MIPSAIISAMALAGVVAASAPVEAKGQPGDRGGAKKVAVCHRDAHGWHRIEVAQVAATRLATKDGNGYPGDEIPGTDAVFGDDCTPLVIVPEPEPEVPSLESLCDEVGGIWMPGVPTAGDDACQDLTGAMQLAVNGSEFVGRWDDSCTLSGRNTMLYWAAEVISCE